MSVPPAGRSRTGAALLGAVVGAIAGLVLGAFGWPLVAVFVFGEIEFHSGFWRTSLERAPFVGLALGALAGAWWRFRRPGPGGRTLT